MNITIFRHDDHNINDILAEGREYEVQGTRKDFQIA